MTSRLAPTFALLSALALAGCGGGPIREHARGVVVASGVLTLAGAAIAAARSAELDACEDEPCLDAGEERWLPVVGAHGVAVDAVTSWQEALELALRVDAGGDPQVLDLLLEVAGLAVQSYVRLRESLAPFNLELPALELPWTRR